MSVKIKKLLPIIVLSALVFAAYIVTSNPPTAKRGRPSSTPQLSVQVQKLTRSDLALTIDSYGILSLSFLPYGSSICATTNNCCEASSKAPSVRTTLPNQLWRVARSE